MPLADKDIFVPDWVQDGDAHHEDLMVGQMAMYARDFHKIFARFAEMQRRFQHLEATNKGLLDSGHLLARVYAGITEFSFLTNFDGDFVAADDTAARLFGIGETGAKNICEALPKEQSELARALLQGLGAAPHENLLSFNIRAKELQSTDMTVGMHVSIVEMANRQMCLWVGRLSKQRLDRPGFPLAQEMQRRGALTFSLDGELHACDQAFAAFSNQPLPKLKKHWLALLDLRPSVNYGMEGLIKVALMKGGWQGEVKWQKSNSEVVSLWMCMQVLRGIDGSDLTLVASFSDCQMVRSAQRFMQSSLAEDGVRLPGLNQIEGLMRDRVSYSLRQSRLVYLVAFEVVIKGTVVTELEDLEYTQLMTVISQRILKTIRGCDLAADLSPGAFVVLLDSNEQATEAMTILSRLKNELSQPLIVERKRCSVSVNMGYIKVDSSEFVLKELIQSASLSMKMSRSQGLGLICSLDDSAELLPGFSSTHH